jgi:hypothetical protein
MKKLTFLIFVLISFSGFAQTGTYTVMDTTMGLPSNQISCLKVISPNEYWVGTYDKGAAKYLNGNWSYYNTHNTLLPDSFIHDIEVDKTGKVWVSTIAGIGIFNGTNWQILDSLNSPISTATTSCHDYLTNLTEIDSAGNIWIASLNKLIKYDGINYTNYLYPPQNTSLGTMTSVCTGSLDPISEFDIHKKSNTFLVSSMNQIYSTSYVFDGTNFSSLLYTNQNYNGRSIEFISGCADSLSYWFKGSDADSAFATLQSMSFGTWVSNFSSDTSIATYYLADSIQTGLVKNPNNAKTYGKISISPFNNYVWATNTNNISHYDRNLGANWTIDTSLHINGNITAIDFDSNGSVYFGCKNASQEVGYFKQTQLSQKGLVIYHPNYPVTGIESLNIEDIKIGPSPTIRKITFYNPNPKDLQVEILNVSGQLIVKQKITQGKNLIDLLDNSNGLYFYVVKDNNVIVKKGKIVKSE